MSSTSSQTPSSRQARRQAARKKPKGSPAAATAATTAGPSSSDVARLLMSPPTLDNPFVGSARVNSQRLLEPTWTEFTGASGDSVMGRDNVLKGDKLIAALTTHLANRAMDPSVPSSMNEIVTDTSSRASLWIMGEIKGLNSSYEDFSLSPKEKDQVGTIVTSLVTLYANDEETFLADIQVDLVLVHEAEEILLKESASASGSSTNNNSSAAEESPLAVLNQKLDAAAMTFDEERERVLLGNLDLLSQGMERITMLTRRLIERETETSQADATNMWDLMAESGDGLPARAHQLRRSLFVLRERRVPTLDEYRSMMPTSLQKSYDEDVLGKK